jgi:hypothetical protein
MENDVVRLGENGESQLFCTSQPRIKWRVDWSGLLPAFHRVLARCRGYQASAYASFADDCDLAGPVGWDNAECLIRCLQEQEGLTPISGLGLND